MNEITECKSVEYHVETKTWFCPYCGICLAYEKTKDYWRFCPVCGQKIVWEDAEKKGIMCNGK